MLQSNLAKVIKYDVNLLVTLYFLLKTRQVSKAATQLFIGQSAVSHQLARLREVFDDPLLVRSAHGMMMTPFAQRLYPTLEIMVADLEGIFDKNQPDTEPLPMKETYRICVPDDVYIDEVSLLFYDFAHKEGLEGKVTFEVFTRYDQCIQDLNDGKIDFFFGHCNSLSNNVCVSELVELEHFFTVRRGHPLAGRRVTLRDISRYPWIELMFREQLDLVIRQCWGETIKHMRCTLKTSSASAALALINHSDSVCVFSGDVIERRGLEKLRLAEPALKTTAFLYWHKVVDNDGFHRHIREGLLRRYVRESVFVQ